jgi:hypothetical protein
MVRHIHNVVDDIRRELPLREAEHFIAVGADVRFAAARILGDDAPKDAVPVKCAAQPQPGSPVAGWPIQPAGSCL